MTASLNPYISHFGEEFDAEKSSQYRMAIQFSLGGLSFALLDSQTNTLIGLEFYQSDLLTGADELFRTLERALATNGLNGKTFQSVYCLFDNRFCTLVPEPLFEETEQAKYLDLTFQIPDGYAIASEKIEKAHCFNVFAYPKSLQEKILSKWENAQIKHTTSLFINKVLENQPDTSISVNVRNRDFDMLVKKDGQLQFFNNFKFNTKEDFAYFLLFAMEQNKLSGQDTPVRFSGLIRPASDIVDLCGRYLRDFQFVEDTHELKVSKDLDEVPYQYYHIHYQTLR